MSPSWVKESVADRGAAIACTGISVTTEREYLVSGAVVQSIAGHKFPIPQFPDLPYIYDRVPSLETGTIPSVPRARSLGENSTSICLSTQRAHRRQLAGFDLLEVGFQGLELRAVGGIESGKR
jgi:hypothetical protein